MPYVHDAPWVSVLSNQMLLPTRTNLFPRNNNNTNIRKSFDIHNYTLKIFLFVYQ